MSGIDAQVAFETILINYYATSQDSLGLLASIMYCDHLLRRLSCFDDVLWAAFFTVEGQGYTQNARYIHDVLTVVEEKIMSPALVAH